MFEIVINVINVENDVPLVGRHLWACVWVKGQLFEH